MHAANSDSPAKVPGGAHPAEWVDMHGDALFRFAMLRLRDRETAEELVQDTFLAALRGKAAFEERSSERTWLIAILRYKIVDHLRARKVQAGKEKAEPPDPEWFDRKGKWKTPVASWSADPASLAANKEFRKIMDDCLSRLPPALREAFTLRESEGMETSEICKALGVTASNLWTQLHRARMRLRQCLESNWFLGAWRLGRG